MSSTAGGRCADVGLKAKARSGAKAFSDAGSNAKLESGSKAKPDIESTAQADAKHDVNTLVNAKASKKRMTTDATSNQPLPKKGHWSGGLLQSINDSNLHVYSDEEIVIIKDKFPKARHHYLVLPKETLHSIADIKSHHLPLLQHIDKTAREFVAEKHPDASFRFGYHAIPSMAQVHLHAISQDFDSPCLKTKKHWNSFTTNYFIDSTELLDLLRKDHLIKTSGKTKDLLNLPLKCHRCDASPKNMPELKKHLLKHCS